MNSEQVKKINAPYLLSYILVPAAVTALCYLVGYLFFHDGGMGAVICFLVPPVLSILWWIYGGKLIFRRKRTKLMREFEQSGFRPNHTFDSDVGTVIVDIGQGKIALLFFWNPFQNYILPHGRWEIRRRLPDGQQPCQLPIHGRQCPHQGQYIHIEQTLAYGQRLYPYRHFQG